ncbi:MAG: hypothetical protein ACKOPU_06840 [Candidatus Planktophila sp.]
MEDSVNNSFNYAPQDDGHVSSAPLDPRVSLARKLSLIFLSVSLVLSALTSFSLLNSSSSDYSYSSSDYGTDDLSTSSTEEDYSDGSWIPFGFTAWSDDSSLAYKYSDVGDYDCTDYNCVEISFVSEYDCPSNFYAAANYLDGPDGSVIGYDNNSLPSLRAGQVAKLLFEDTSNTSLNWQIAEINCY